MRGYIREDKTKESGDDRIWRNRRSFDLRTEAEKAADKAAEDAKEAKKAAKAEEYKSWAKAHDEEMAAKNKAAEQAFNGLTEAQKCLVVEIAAWVDFNYSKEESHKKWGLLNSSVREEDINLSFRWVYKNHKLMEAERLKLVK